MTRASGRNALSWDALEPDEQDALDRIWRGVETAPDEASPLVEAGLAVRQGEALRLTDQGECLVLARLPALRLARGSRGRAPLRRLPG